MQTPLPASSEKLENGTPILATVVLPEVEYSPEAQAVIDEMVYRFPSCAGCGH